MILLSNLVVPTRQSAGGNSRTIGDLFNRAVARSERCQDVEHGLDFVAHLVLPVVWTSMDDAAKFLHESFKWETIGTEILWSPPSIAC
jgi:hypothetical protein